MIVSCHGQGTSFAVAWRTILDGFTKANACTWVDVFLELHNMWSWKTTVRFPDEINSHQWQTVGIVHLVVSQIACWIPPE